MLDHSDLTYTLQGIMAAEQLWLNISQLMVTAVKHDMPPMTQIVSLSDLSSVILCQMVSPSDIL